MQYGLKKENIEKIKQVLASFIEIDEAILYGSRAKGNFKLGSDIDFIDSVIDNGRDSRG